MTGSRGSRDGSTVGPAGPADVAAMLVPWAAVLAFWVGLRSAWATIVSYHALMLLFSWRRLPYSLKGWHRGQFLLHALPCLAAGPLTYVLLPVITKLPVAFWLSRHGLEGASLLLMVPWYGLVHPFIEQAHWGRLRAIPGNGIPAAVMFAGYHGLVLQSLMKPLWVAVCVVVLFGTSFAWRRIERRAGGLLVPALTQVLADAGMILAALASNT